MKSDAKRAGKCLTGKIHKLRFFSKKPATLRPTYLNRSVRYCLEEVGEFQFARNHPTDSLNGIELIVECDNAAVCFTEFVIDLCQLNALGIQLVERRDEFLILLCQLIKQLGLRRAPNLIGDPL